MPTSIESQLAEHTYRALSQFSTLTPKTRGVVCLSGMPGSGKTALGIGLAMSARETGAPSRVLSADTYMIESRGVYLFQPHRLFDCHSRTMKDFIRECQTPGAHHALTVIANTSSTEGEVTPYALVASAFNLPFLHIKLIPESFSEAFARNIHGVSETSALDMYSRVKALELPPYIYSRTVYVPTFTA